MIYHHAEVLTTGYIWRIYSMHLEEASPCPGLYNLYFGLTSFTRIFIAEAYCGTTLYTYFVSGNLPMHHVRRGKFRREEECFAYHTRIISGRANRLLVVMVDRHSERDKGPYIFTNGWLSLIGFVDFVLPRHRGYHPFSQRSGQLPSIEYMWTIGDGLVVHGMLCTTAVKTSYSCVHKMYVCLVHVPGIQYFKCVFTVGMWTNISQQQAGFVFPDTVRYVLHVCCVTWAPFVCLLGSKLV